MKNIRVAFLLKKNNDLNIWGKKKKGDSKHGHTFSQHSPFNLKNQNHHMILPF